MSDSKQAKFDEALEELIQERVNEELKRSIEDDGFILLRHDAGGLNVVFLGPEKEVEKGEQAEDYEYSIDLAELIIRDAEVNSEKGRAFYLECINGIAEMIKSMQD